MLKLATAVQAAVDVMLPQMLAMFAKSTALCAVVLRVTRWAWMEAYKQANGWRWFGSVLRLGQAFISAVLRKFFLGPRDTRALEAGAAGMQECRRRYFHLGFNKSILGHVMCIQFTDVAQVADAARNLEILRDRDDYDRSEQHPGEGRRAGGLLLVNMGQGGLSAAETAMKNTMAVVGSCDKKQRITARCSVILIWDQAPIRRLVSSDTVATIDCHSCRVIFGDIHTPEFIYHGSLPGKSVKIISALKARTLLSHGCEAETISKTPYRMAPIELKELKDQLQELFGASFFRATSGYHSMGLHRFCFVKKKDGRGEEIYVSTTVN
ncbi:hypothetical protein Tco_0527272 [Tanacetum coccineum]